MAPLDLLWPKITTCRGRWWSCFFRYWTLPKALRHIKGSNSMRFQEDPRGFNTCCFDMHFDRLWHTLTLHIWSGFSCRRPVRLHRFGCRTPRPQGYSSSPDHLAHCAPGSCTARWLPHSDYDSNGDVMLWWAVPATSAPSYMPVGYGLPHQPWQETQKTSKGQLSSSSVGPFTTHSLLITFSPRNEVQSARHTARSGVQTWNRATEWLLYITVHHGTSLFQPEDVVTSHASRTTWHALTAKFRQKA